MRLLGIEPRLPVWKAGILPLDDKRLIYSFLFQQKSWYNLKIFNENEKLMRLLGVEPRLPVWQTDIIPLDHKRLYLRINPLLRCFDKF
jgi:hypothetical protein